MDHASGMFWTVLEEFFDRAQKNVSTVLEICFGRSRCMFRPCSDYVSLMLEVCFDRTRGMFRLCSRNVSTVLEVCFDRLEVSSNGLEVCLDLE